ncbi:MAG: RNA polymerase sigma factor, partial [Candidatus Eremiobacteraeota bacterium]|nr:RNA polymerase sigma factor [Candidatus Eremiobacteraeota bacterium]
MQQIYANESRRVLATLIRLLGDFNLAEDALHDAFVAAAEQWPVEGIPNNPTAWLISTGRFKAINAIRRRARFDASLGKIAEELSRHDPGDFDVETIKDDDLRLVFICCHPALALEAQIALTLREVCGLTTEEIAKAFVTKPSTIAQRIVRAKSKIRTARVPYEIPSAGALPERLDGVLRVIYLLFNEGYEASFGAALTRVDLCAEAIRLGRLLTGLLPQPEVYGLLALMLFHHARRHARTASSGDLVLLGEQDRSRWDTAQIAEADALLGKALSHGKPGIYACQAAIARLHTHAQDSASTDWQGVVAWYDALLELEPSPVIELNRASAIAMRDDANAGLRLMNAILERGDLTDYRFAHSARADMYRRLGRRAEARAAYETALALTNQESERRFLRTRIAELE